MIGSAGFNLCWSGAWSRAGRGADRAVRQQFGSGPDACGRTARRAWLAACSLARRPWSDGLHGFP